MKPVIIIAIAFVLLIPISAFADVGQLVWDQDDYGSATQATIQLIDNNLNLQDGVRESYSIDVWSDSDAGGIDIELIETNPSSGIFEGTLFFTTTDESDNLTKTLRVSHIDGLTAEMEYGELPTSHPAFSGADIVGFAAFFVGEPPTINITISNVKLVDEDGNQVTSVDTGERIGFSADVTNLSIKPQAISFVVEIKDESGNFVDKAWITYYLEHNQKENIVLSHFQNTPGTYSAEIRVAETEISSKIFATSNIPSFQITGEQILTPSEKIERLELQINELIAQIASLTSQINESEQENTLLQEPLEEEKPEPEPKPLVLASFVDETKDPQSYVDRYNNESDYKKWFDSNFPEYSSIYEAIGLPTPIPEWVRGIFVFWGVDEISDTELKNAIVFLVDSEIIILN